MNIDFSKAMTIYELLALVLAVIALLVPLVKWIWNKWILKAKVSFLPIGRAVLYFNQSGSYIRVDGVYEAENKPICVKMISISLTRQKDDRKLNLSWSSFISPVNQSMVGNYLQTTESAHPFRIEADSVVSAFTEFGDMFNAFGKTFAANTSILFGKIPELREQNQNYNTALLDYKRLPEYDQAKELLKKEFFWEVGKYDIDICVEYGKEKKYFSWSVAVGETEYTSLVGNIDEALLSPLKDAYGVRWDYHAAVVELQAK